MPASTRPRHKKPPVPREDVLDLVAPARLRCPAPVPPARCRPDPPIRRRRRHHSPACPDSGAIARRCSAPVPPRSRTQPASAHSRSRSADAYAPPPPTCLFVSCVNSSALVTSVPTASIACYAAFKTPFTGRLPRLGIPRSRPVTARPRSDAPRTAVRTPRTASGHPASIACHVSSSHRGASRLDCSAGRSSRLPLRGSPLSPPRYRIPWAASQKIQPNRGPLGGSSSCLHEAGSSAQPEDPHASVVARRMRPRC